MRRWKLATAIIIALIAVAAYFASTRFFAAVVISYSMEPTLRVGDVVIVDKCADIKVGDVVVYVKGGRLIVHRVIKITEYGGELRYLTKGDANAVPDAPSNAPFTWLTRDRIIGKVVFVIPYVGIFRVIFSNML